MRSLKSTPQYRCFVILSLSLLSTQGFSQINSPYSRYGLGDLYNSRNVTSKALGNLATPYIDYQSVNFINPSSYSRLQGVTFDVGIEFESRQIQNADKTDNFRSNNLTYNYLTLGLPLLKNKQGVTTWGMAFGLRPMSRMNYSIVKDEYLQDIQDSATTLFKGNGGASKAFIGTGFRIKGLSLGANIGFIFGQQNVRTQRSFPDSLYHYSTNYESTLSYSHVYADAGAQYDIKLGKKSVLRLGFSGFLGDKMTANRDLVRETIVYNATNGFDSIDVVYRETNRKGDIDLPMGYTAGIMFDKQGSWMVGAEYETVKWGDYTYYGATDQVGDSKMFRAGAQWTPSQMTKKYLARVTYRAGFYTGDDYIQVNSEQLPTWGITCGFGFPLRRWNNYSNQYSVVNTSFEYGRRANQTFPIQESFFRLNVGLCLSDLWFVKRKFD